MVNFPLTDLDVGKYRAAGTAVNVECGTVYDLVSCSNHYGGLGGGHYTAYGRITDTQWAEFDDSSARPCTASKVQSSAAYVLFYMRRR